MLLDWDNRITRFLETAYDFIETTHMIYRGAADLFKAKEKAVTKKKDLIK